MPDPDAMDMALEKGGVTFDKDADCTHPASGCSPTGTNEYMRTRTFEGA